jgi:membrane dipeptidase
VQGRLGLDVHEQRGHGVLGPVGHVTRQELERHDRQRIDVAALVHPPAACLLGAHVLGSAHRVAGSRRSFTALGDAEVHHADAPLAVEHDVGGLEVAVDDAGGVNGFQPAGRLRHQLQRFAGGQGALAHALLEADPVHQLHRDPAQAVALAVLVDARHVGIGHLAGQPDLGAEAAHEVLLAGQLGTQDLQRHRLVQHAVARLVDGAHPAAAQQAQDLVAAAQDRPPRQGGQHRAAGEAHGRAPLVGGAAARAEHRAGSITLRPGESMIRYMNLRSLSTLAAILLASPAAPARAAQPSPAAEDANLARARRILRSVPLIDGHNDVPWAIRDKAGSDLDKYDLRTRTPGQTDLRRLREGGLGAQFWSVYVPGELKSGWAHTQLEQIELARRMIERYPDRLELALTAGDVERAFRRGHIGSLLGMEGGHVIENSLGALRGFYRLGARYMTLTHNVTLDWADCAAEPPKHGGLTRFGEEVVREMNRLGMLVDLSHVSPDTMEDALRVSEAPVIFSHSSARALVDVPRNVPDAILRQLPRNGGLVMVSFVPAFVNGEVARVYGERQKQIAERTKGVTDAAEKDRIEKEIRDAPGMPVATLAQVADHVEHVRKVAGADHVGIGSDFDGIDKAPADLEDVSRYPYLFAELARRGWSDEDLKKLAGLNMLRVMRQAEDVSRRLQAARPASTATIEQLDGGTAAK